jgi:hypothetical protein
MLRSILSGFILAFSAELLSQTPLVITKMTGIINFDGVPDEEAWQNVPELPMVMFMPVSGNKPAEHSLIKISYDNEYLYFSAILDYLDPKNMKAFSKKRDYSSATTDWLGIVIDSFYDRKNAVAFWTNPNGLRTDGAVKNDCNDSNTDLTFSWTTFWDVKTVISKKGWSAEMRIPFSSLRFQVRDNKTIMGITIVRFDVVKYEVSTFPQVSQNFSNAFWRPSLTLPVEFTGLKPKKPVYVAPYATAGVQRMSELNDAGTAYIFKNSLKYDAGIDIKYGLTNNLTADITVNTDFAQVEADDQKINLTRYSLYFPEKRTFFQEKADVFDFNFQGDNYLFYSRRIGLVDGNPVRILGGARMTGRINKWDIGFLDLQTAKFEENPGANFGVLRTKRNIFNQNSYIGGMLTTKLNTDGTYNLAYGLDGQIRVKGNNYMTVRMAQTFESDSSKKILNLAPTRLMFDWENRNLKGFAYDFLYSYSGTRYNPGLGFEMMDNYQGAKGIFRYGWFPGDSSSIRYHYASLTTYNLWSTATNRQMSFYSQLMWYFETKKGSYGYAYANLSRENLTDSLTLGNDQAYVPPGKYSFLDFLVYYGTNTSHTLSATLSAESGKFYDGGKLSFFASPQLNLGSDVSLGLTYYFDYVNFKSRSVSFTNHIAGIKGLITFSTKTYIQAYLQYNTGARKILTNFRLRYNPSEGNDFYIVYDEGMNTNLIREIPNLPLSIGRTLLLKYTYTFRF